MPSLPNAGAGVALRYAQLEELVVAFLDVNEDRRTSLTARFRLFRQRGFPPNVKGESKARFNYDLDAVIRVLVAFQLLDGLVPQETVPALIESCWTQIRDAFDQAFRLLAQKGADAANADDDRSLLVVQPRNLAMFSQARQPEVEQPMAAEARVVSAQQFVRDMRHPDYDGLSPRVVIDLQRVAGWMRDALIAGRWAVPESFRPAE